MEIEKQNEELTHAGIKGMHWGIRRYQYKNGRLTPEGRKRYNQDMLKLKEKNAKLDEKIKNKSAQERAKARLQKLKEEANAKKLAAKGKNKVEDEVEETKKPDDNDPKAKESYEAAKQKALKSGNASEIMKYQGDLTNEQLNQAITRINYEKQLASMSASELSPGMKKVDSIMNKVHTVTDWAEKGAKAYDMFASINNAFSDKQMPLILSGKRGWKPDKPKNQDNDADDGPTKQQTKADKKAAKAEKKAEKEKAAEQKESKSDKAYNKKQAAKANAEVDSKIDAFEKAQTKKDIKEFEKAQKQQREYDAEVQRAYVKSKIANSAKLTDDERGMLNGSKYNPKAKPDKSRVIAMYRMGKDPADIAKELGVQVTAVNEAIPQKEVEKRYKK